MSKKQAPTNRVREFERALQDAQQAPYTLRLFIAGHTPRSIAAIQKIRQVCEERLQGRYLLEVIDIQQQPQLAKDAQIIATPTLIKSLPPPLRKIVGDLSRAERILVALDLFPGEAAPAAEKPAAAPQADPGSAAGAANGRDSQAE